MRLIGAGLFFLLLSIVLPDTALAISIDLEVSRSAYFVSIAVWIALTIAYSLWVTKVGRVPPAKWILRALLLIASNLLIAIPNFLSLLFLAGNASWWYWKLSERLPIIGRFVCPPNTGIGYGLDTWALITVGWGIIGLLDVLVLRYLLRAEAAKHLGTSFTAFLCRRVVMANLVCMAVQLLVALVTLGNPYCYCHWWGAICSDVNILVN
ncbi:MAG: hypothetical protein K1X79_05325 [Oligoflexia bacterium]|nr:hypothetical protein [Oligoflexia bacterium]